MSDEIKVIQAGMSTLIDRLHDSVNAFDAILRRLDDDVAKLRGAWSGEASDAYDQAQKAWSNQLEEMNALLASHRRDSIATAERFKDAVSKNTQVWS